MFGLKIIEKLIDSNYRVIFRPHPELLKRHNNVIQKILNRTVKLGDQTIWASRQATNRGVIQTNPSPSRQA